MTTRAHLYDSPILHFLSPTHSRTLDPQTELQQDRYQQVLLDATEPSLKRSAEKHPARSSSMSFLLLHLREQVMGCAASTERQGEWRDTASQSLREIKGVLRWSGLYSTNLIIGVDFTRSNLWNGKQSFGGRSLHFIDPANTVLNPYQIVINIICRTLHSRKSKKPIHVFGFGDSFTADRCVFTFLPDGSPCRGVRHVLKRYKEITPELMLGGPTNFAPIIYHAIRQVKTRGACQILVIIADGQVTSEKETSQAIVEASKYALSIIVVGVGDGPWDAMDHYKATLPKQKFENFHFVSLNQAMSENPDQPVSSFATAALAHVPDQLATIRRLGLLQPLTATQEVAESMNKCTVAEK